MKLALKSVLTAAALAVATPALARDIIGVSHGQPSDPFWSVEKYGAEQAAVDTGANVSYRAPEIFDMVAMSQLIDAAVNQESDGLIVSIPDGDATFAIDLQQYLQGYLPVVFLALHAKYSLMPGGDVPSGPNLITAEKAAQVIDLSAQGIRRKLI